MTSCLTGFYIINTAVLQPYILPTFSQEPNSFFGLPVFLQRLDKLCARQALICAAAGQHKFPSSHTKMSELAFPFKKLFYEWSNSSGEPAVFSLALTSAIQPPVTACCMASI